MVTAGVTVTRLSDEAPQADGHTWYNVQVGGQTGWMASDWFRPGDCNAAASGGETPTIIDNPTDDWGNTWLDADADTAHYGADFSSTTGDTTIASPYSGRVVAEDPCDACVDEAHPNGRRDNEFVEEYNWGYGAMTVVEFRYEDLTEAERAELVEDGVVLNPGQSLYMMIAHLDPTQPISDAGTMLGPGDTFSTMGTSGNSSGVHAHVETAVNESGLSPDAAETTFGFWTDTVAERPEVDEPGLRFDPTPLFDISE